MNIYFCPACGHQHNYTYDKPAQCTNCNVIFAKAFNSSASYTKRQNTEVIKTQVENEEEVDNVPEITEEDSKDILVETGSKPQRVTVGDIWNDKQGSNISAPREKLKIKGKKQLALKAKEILGSAKTSRPKE